ncbi:MAG: hypothetical protein ABJE47_18115 [bacterium]
MSVIAHGATLFHARRLDYTPQSGMNAFQELPKAIYVASGCLVLTYIEAEPEYRRWQPRLLLFAKSQAKPDMPLAGDVHRHVWITLGADGRSAHRTIARGA